MWQELKAELAWPLLLTLLSRLTSDNSIAISSSDCRRTPGRFSSDCLISWTLQVSTCHFVDVLMWFYHKHCIMLCILSFCMPFRLSQTSDVTSTLHCRYIMVAIANYTLAGFMLYWNETFCTPQLSAMYSSYKVITRVHGTLGTE